MRYNSFEKELRTRSLEDAKLENEAERREWNNILLNNSVVGIELNSELYSPETLVKQCVNYLNNEFILGENYQLVKKKKD